MDLKHILHNKIEFFEEKKWKNKQYNPLNTLKLNFLKKQIEKYGKTKQAGFKPVPQ
jgi:hypothetical protein